MNLRGHNIWSSPYWIIIYDYKDINLFNNISLLHLIHNIIQYVLYYTFLKLGIHIKNTNCEARERLNFVMTDAIQLFQYPYPITWFVYSLGFVVETLNIPYYTIYFPEFDWDYQTNHVYSTVTILWFT